MSSLEEDSAILALVTMNVIFNQKHLSRVKFIPCFLFSLGITALLTSCQTQIINPQASDEQIINGYEATAVTTITWRVNYADDSKRGRYEEFASASLTNRNGQKPEGGIVCPQQQDLWCPKLPPRPSIDEIEARRKSNYEKFGQAERLWTDTYYITYQKDGQTLTLPTNYQVYRQVVKAYPQQIPLKLTMGINNGSVLKATPMP